MLVRHHTQTKTFCQFPPGWVEPAILLLAGDLKTSSSQWS